MHWYFFDFIQVQIDIALLQFVTQYQFALMIYNRVIESYKIILGFYTHLLKQIYLFAYYIFINCDRKIYMRFIITRPTSKKPLRRFQTEWLKIFPTNFSSILSETVCFKPCFALYGKSSMTSMFHMKH